MEKQKELKSLIARLKGLQLIKTQKELAERIGFDKTNLSSAINGNENYLTDSLFSKIYNEFPELGTHEKSKIFQPELVSEEFLPPSTNIKVPYYDVDFAGGWTTEELFSNQNPLFIITNPAFDRSDFACNLYGRSVSKRIPSGSIIGLKKIDDWQIYFPTNELYGIITKNDLRTVKLAKRSTDKEKLVLISCPLDAESESEEIPINFITTFFQIVAWEKFERLVN